MSGDILAKIAAYKREEVAARKAARPTIATAGVSPTRGFRAALERAHTPGRLALIAEARRRTTGQSPAFTVSDAANLAYSDGTFDAVRADRVLQHVDSIVDAVREMARVTHGGGPATTFFGAVTGFIVAGRKPAIEVARGGSHDRGASRMAP